VSQAGPWEVDSLQADWASRHPIRISHGLAAARNVDGLIRLLPNLDLKLAVTWNQAGRAWLANLSHSLALWTDSA
jgi:hypothetical protein